MVEPVGAGVIVAKEAAEKAALAIHESMKLSEIVKTGMERLKTSDLNKMKELYRNPSDHDKGSFNHLFKEVAKAKLNPEEQASLMNRLMTDSSLKGQMGEYHAKRTFSPYASMDRPIIPREESILKFDLEGAVKEKMPVKTYTLKSGELKAKSYVIKPGTKIGVEVKNGVTQLTQNPEHTIKQALVARARCGNAFISISETMRNEIIKNPQQFERFFNLAEQNDIKTIVAQPTISQQIDNMLSQA